MKKAKNTEQILYITTEQNGFDMLTRNISRNTFLSDGAKALYIYLNSHSENFNLSKESIASYLHKSTDTIKREIAELKKHGFLVLERKENSNCYYYKLRTSPKIEQIKSFDNESIINAFFDTKINFDLQDIDGLYKRNLITKKDYEIIINRIFEIVKTNWLD